MSTRRGCQNVGPDTARCTTTGPCLVLIIACQSPSGYVEYRGQTTNTNTVCVCGDLQWPTGALLPLPPSLCLMSDKYFKVFQVGRFGGNPIQQWNSQFLGIRLLVDDDSDEHSINEGCERLRVGTKCSAIGGREPNLVGPLKYAPAKLFRGTCLLPWLRRVDIHMSLVLLFGAVGYQWSSISQVQCHHSPNDV
jgi:hypothetical protein